MNEILFTRNLLLGYIFFGFPATIIIIKIILEHIFSLERIEKQSYTKFKFIKALKKKYNCSDFYDFHDYGAFVIWNIENDYRKLSTEEVNEKYPELESDYQKLKKLENSNQKLKKIRYFLDRFSIRYFWWLIYCLISWILLFVGVIYMAFESYSYNKLKKFYDNGKYTTITQFEKYEILPYWDKNAKHCISKAEVLNNTYFNTDGSIKTGVLEYIIPDENGKYPILDDAGKPTGKYLEPINTNQMWKSFLKICQNEEEVIK